VKRALSSGVSWRRYARAASFSRYAVAQASLAFEQPVTLAKLSWT